MSFEEWPPKHRSISHNPRFEAALASYRTGDPPDAVDEAVLALEWAVSRDPERYEVVPETVTPLRVAHTRPYRELPAFAVYFSIDNDDECTFRDLMATELFEDEEDVS